MKLVVAALAVFAALSAAGAAAPQPPTCCTQDFDPQWSQDGSHIAFVRREPSGVSAFFTMAANGADERELVSLGSDFPSFQPRPPLLSPNWTRLALIGPTSTLKIETVLGHQVQEIAKNVSTFAWSPDSQRLAFDQAGPGNSSSILAVNADGSDLKSLGAGQEPAWSKDGGHLAFIAPNGKLYVMNADGTGRTVVYDGNGVSAYAPSWSPSGDRIAFFTASQLFVISSDGRLVFSTFADSFDPPRWSPDGALIAVESPSSITVVQVGTQNFWSFRDHSDPSWSPEENVFAASFDGPCQRRGIYRMAVPSTSQRLTLDCHIRGTSGPDDLTGTPSRDIISGLAGDDELLGGDGEDRLIAGPGNDTLLGGNLGDRLEGGYGADLLIGGNFQQSATAEIDDRLFGGPGADDLRGGPGRDSLNGDTGNDILRGGPDEDSLYGGPGNDRIFASGDPVDDQGRPAPDFVACGGGRHDVAFVDRRDHVSGCETVHRR